jgi:hypothetical protein
MRIFRRATPVFVACAMLTVASYAQYETPHEFAVQETRYFSAGVMLHDFGPRAGYTGGDSLAIAFKAWMPTIGYRQGMLDAQFGYTRYSLKGGTRTAVFFCTALSNDLPLVGQRPATLVVPLMLSLDYTKAESPGSERDHFNVASLGLGAGLKLRLMSPGTEFSAHAVGIYHYSFEGFSTSTGSSFAMVGEASLILRTIHIGDGLVLGYRFRHQSWSLAGGRLNYHVTTHGPYVGILL